MHLFLNLSVKELPKFHGKKKYLIAELFIFKHRRQNISISNTELLTAVTCPEVTLCCENSFDVLAIGDGVGCYEQSGAYRLVLHWSRYKKYYYRDVLLHQQLLPAIRDLWRLLYFSTEQRSCPQGAFDRATVNLWNTRLHRSSSVASQQSWPEPGRLPDVVETSQPDAWHWPTEVTPDRRVGTFSPGVHRWSDQAVASTSSSLLAFEHTEDILNTDFSYVWYLYRRTLWQSYDCTVAHSGHYCFGVTSLNPL